MKIISGTLKGRRINGYDIEGTRPTMDRVKESLFGMIQEYVKESLCLDLFAGSGNLGLEAISNGAKMCYFNDKNIKCIKTIQKNIVDFNIQAQAKVFNLDYKALLKKMVTDNRQFDIIFLDPPYKTTYLNEIILFIINNNLLNNDGIIVCEVDNDYLNSDFSNLEIIKKRQYSDKFIIIYKKTSL